MLVTTVLNKNESEELIKKGKLSNMSNLYRLSKLQEKSLEQITAEHTSVGTGLVFGLSKIIGQYPVNDISKDVISAMIPMEPTDSIVYFNMLKSFGVSFDLTEFIDIIQETKVLTNEDTDLDYIKQKFNLISKNLKELKDTPNCLFVSSRFLRKNIVAVDVLEDSWDYVKVDLPVKNLNVTECIDVF